MYVYVKFEGYIKVINNVTIDDDCGPVVEGNVISDSPRSGAAEGAGSRSTVDAISWFKSLPLEAVYLDCNSRDARWCSKAVTIQQSQSDQNEHLLTPKVSVRLRKAPHKRVHINEAALRVDDGQRPFMPENARRLFSDHPGVVDFNPIIDEMFERAEELVRKWDHLRDSGLLYREVAQILHCYVFPAVSFQKDDIPALQECLRLVAMRQDTVEREITGTEKSIDVTEKYLNKHKEVILSIQELTTQAYLQACDAPFVESLYTHITKDIQKKNARLETVQLKINELRKVANDLQRLDNPRKAADDLQRLDNPRKAADDLQRPDNPRKAADDLQRPDNPRKAADDLQKPDNPRKTGEDTQRLDKLKKTGEDTERLDKLRKTGEDTERLDNPRKTGEDTERLDKPRKMGEDTERLDKLKKTGVDTERLEKLKKTGVDTERLDKLKKERDGFHEVLQKLIVVREAIRNHLYRPFIPKKKKRRGTRRVVLSKKDANMHIIFQQVHAQLVEHKDTLRKLCYRKLHTSSVREALESTIKMVSRENGPGSGPGSRGMGDMSEFSVYLGSEADSRREQWQSMQATVDEWMSSGDNAMFRAHSDGCQLVRDLADGILSDVQVASMGLEDSSQAGAGDLEMSCLSSQHGANTVDRRDSEVDLSYRRAPMVRVMRDQVRVHTWEIAENIVNHMGFQVVPGSRHINRAWICYCPHFWRQSGEAVERVYTHFHAPQARRVYSVIRAVALSDIMDSNFFRDFFTHRLSTISSSSGSERLLEEEESAVKFKPPDAVSAISLDLMRCSVSDLYARVNRDGARLNYEMLEMEALSGSFDIISIVPSELSEDSNSSSGRGGGGGKVGTVDYLAASSTILTAGETGTDHGAEHQQHPELGPSDSSASDSGASIHSDDLFDTDGGGGGGGSGASSTTTNPHPGGQNPGRSVSQTETVRSSQTVASVLSLFELVVEPYQQLVQAVLDAPDVMEKLRAVWKSVDFLCQKAGEICHARGMDTLLPLSIFATTSFPEELFVLYYIQLLILTDLKPSFAFHSMYDFSLTNAISSYMYLFQAKFPPVPAASSDESD